MLSPPVASDCSPFLFALSRDKCGVPALEAKRAERLAKKGQKKRKVPLPTAESDDEDAPWEVEADDKDEEADEGMEEEEEEAQRRGNGLL